jgi:plastocyanin
MSMKRRQVIATLAAVGLLGVLGAKSGMLSSGLVASASANSAARVSGKVNFVNSSGEKVSPVERAVLYLKGVPNALPDTSKMVFSVKQKDKQFAPGFIVALKGSTVEFPNEDRIDHNVFSLSKTARFDLGLYRSGNMKSVVMRRSGLIDVYCNIHPEMAAKILVLETKYYAISNPDGSFSIGDVPDGTYDLVAWQPYGEEQTTKVQVTKGKVTQANLTLVRGNVKRSHVRKDGTPYGRYQ